MMDVQNPISVSLGSCFSSQIMQHSSFIFRGLMQFRKENPAASVLVWGEPDRSVIA